MEFANFGAGVVKLCLCSLIFLSGICKLTPKWGEEVFHSMDRAFHDRFTPFWQESFFGPLGVEIDASVTKFIFGSTEVLCAFFLYTPYKVVSSVILFGLMSGVVLTHLFLGEWLEVPMPLALCVASVVVCYVEAMVTGSEGGGRKVKAN